MDPRRLLDLILYPREELEIELKGWLDASQESHRANVAKAILALANHGGGHIVLGIAQSNGAWVADPVPPTGHAPFTQDAVNTIVARYAEPTFHCSVYSVPHPTSGVQYPIIAVPGGHCVPIRAKSEDPERRHIRLGSYYTRLPGPRSEVPTSGAEWNALISRCVRNDRESLLSAMAAFLAAPARPSETLASRLASFEESARSRLSALIADRFNGGDVPQYAHGTWTFSYALSERPAELSLSRLLEVLGSVAGNETGWPPWHVFTRQELRPYPFDNVVECWLVETRGDSHADFWRAAPDGMLFLLRGHQEDTVSRHPSGTVLDPELAIWRIGECALHAARFARAVGVNGDVTIRVRWDGLANRRLVRIDPNRAFLRAPIDMHRCRQASVTTEATTAAALIEPDLARLVRRLTQPLFDAFDFFRPSDELIAAELNEMRHRRR